MKTILCYGDSNTWGCKPIVSPGVVERFDRDVRWTGILRQQLGDDYLVIEEGLNARTTVHDDPIDGAHKNGKPYLLPCLETHLPLDLVIIMLGTNDLKSRFSLSAFDIASGIKPLLEIVASVAPKNDGVIPQSLVIAPPPLARLSVLADVFAGGPALSQQLAPHFEGIAGLFGSHFLDAGALITSSDKDGIHFDEDQHEILGRAVTRSVQGIFADNP